MWPQEHALDCDELIHQLHFCPMSTCYITQGDEEKLSNCWWREKLVPNKNIIDHDRFCLETVLSSKHALIFTSRDCRHFECYLHLHGPEPQTMLSLPQLSTGTTFTQDKHHLPKFLILMLLRQHLQAGEAERWFPTGHAGL